MNHKYLSHITSSLCPLIWLFIQQIFADHQLCAKNYAGCWRKKGARILAATELCLVVPTDIKQMSQILHPK